MKYTNSKLVDYKRLSPNHSGLRTHTIDRITPHCVVGQCTVETLGSIFMDRNYEASCNYGIGKDGRVALIVEEKTVAGVLPAMKTTRGPLPLNVQVKSTLHMK